MIKNKITFLLKSCIQLEKQSFAYLFNWKETKPW